MTSGLPDQKKTKERERRGESKRGRSLDSGAKRRVE